MKFHLNKLTFSVSVLLVWSLVVTQAVAVTEDARETFELCELGHAELIAVWEKGKDLDDEAFKEAFGHKKTAALAAGGDWNTIRQYVLARGIESTKSTEVLWGASSSGRTDIVRKLIELGMSPDGHDVEMVPLSSAVFCGKTQTAIALLELGANPNFQDVTLQDAMTHAVVHEDEEMAKALLDHGYDPCVLELEDGRDINDLQERLKSIGRLQQQEGANSIWQRVVCTEK